MLIPANKTTRTLGIIAAVAGISLILFFAGSSLVKKGHSPYEGFTVAAKPLGNPPQLPDISGYTSDAVRAMLPVPQTGRAGIEAMKDSEGFLPTNELHKDYADMQDVDTSVVIKINSGVYDLPTLHATIKDETKLSHAADGYVLHVPIYVGEGATLVVNGAAQHLKLATDTGAFIASMGKVYIVDTEITGWDVKNNKATAFVDKDTYRPYLVFWNLSNTWIANSTFSHLGYDSAKSYGLTFSTNGPLMKEKPNLAWAKGWIVDSRFSDLYYGLYTYEAEDIAIIGNTYSDNIVYAIDPHDRSRRLIIAKNDTNTTHKKHGIIVSREVHDSWIFNNKSHHNEGVGIMIERNSRNNIVAFNETYQNKGDGLNFYESPDNLSWGNIIRDNENSGIRIRNSLGITSRHDKITGNGAYGFEVYTDDLKEQNDRDLDQDPFEQRVSFDIAGAEFANNKAGQIKVDHAEYGRFQNIEMLQVGSGLVGGDLNPLGAAIYTAMTTEGSAIEIMPLNKKTSLSDKKQQ